MLKITMNKNLNGVEKNGAKLVGTTNVKINDMQLNDILIFKKSQNGVIKYNFVPPYYYNKDKINIKTGEQVKPSYKYNLTMDMKKFLYQTWNEYDKLKPPISKDENLTKQEEYIKNNYKEKVFDEYDKNSYQVKNVYVYKNPRIVNTTNNKFVGSANVDIAGFIEQLKIDIKMLQDGTIDIAFPQKQYKTNDGEIKYKNEAFPVTKEEREEIKNIVVNAYQKQIEKINEKNIVDNQQEAENIENLEGIGLE